MQSDSKSADFIMTAAVYKGFDFISPPHSESSLLYSNHPSAPPPLSFYTDDFFEGFKGFKTQFTFLRDHFFSRIKSAKMMLLFKKLRPFADAIEALIVRHCVEGHIHILNNRTTKIAAFPVPSDQSGVRAFLSVVDITRRWIKNFTELTRSLNRLTNKMN